MWKNNRLCWAFVVKELKTPCGGPFMIIVCRYPKTVIFYFVRKILLVDKMVGIVMWVEVSITIAQLRHELGGSVA